jgi:hypothetical protein
MKAIINIFILFIVLNTGTWMVPQTASAQGYVSYQVFYDDLSPYGTWVNTPDYGYVWVANASPGFTPYGTNGYWVFTDAGWTWVSDYQWGWAPFHYGRWYSDPSYGYMWVPGNEWGPGWVSWRQSEGYYGWTPIGPGIGIDVAYSNGYNVPSDRWTFVRDKDFGRTNINSYRVVPSGNTTIIKSSTVINNIQVDKSSSVKYNAGPNRTEVQKQTGTAVASVALKESSKPGQSISNGELQIFRPRVEKGNAVPSKVSNLKDMKPAEQRNAEAQPQKDNQPVKQQPSQLQNKSQQNKTQPSQPQPDGQPIKPQPSHQQHNSQPAQQQPSQPKQDGQPANQQPSQQQHKNQPNKTQPSQPQPDGQPIKPQPSQPQQSRPEQVNPPQNKGGENPHQPKGQPNKEPQLQHPDLPNNHQPSPPPQNNQPEPKKQPNMEPQHPVEDNHQQPQPRQPEPPQNKEDEGKPHLMSYLENAEVN